MQSPGRARPARSRSTPGRLPRRLRVLALAACLGVAVTGTAALTSSPSLGASASAATPAPVGMWGSTAVPAVPAAADTAAVELGMRFVPSVGGAITSVRFYKGTGNTGRHTAALWDSAGRRLSAATYAGESASGWQSVTLPTPVRLTAGQTYTVSYHTDLGRYALDKGGFATARQVGPLRTPVSAGVYRYGASGYPSATFSSSNYWVDVRFTPDAVAASPAAAGSRNRYAWPFAATSIWNMPIGSGAAYTRLGLTAPTTAYGTDEVYVALDPTAPLRPLVDRGYWWPWNSGTTVTGTSTGISVRVPDAWVIAPPRSGDYPNRASAALQADGTVREWQYTVRPAAGSPISMFEAPRAGYPLTGNGLQGAQVGAHGGSAMIGLGGVVRSGELTGTQPIRHALAVTMNMRKWGTKQGGAITDGHRWPATAADSYYGQTGTASGYGTITAGGGQSKAGLGMGSLLALPADVDLDALGLETAAGKKLAWTHQNYGAYVVDDSQDPGAWDVHRINVEAAVLDEYPALDTYPGTGTPFGRDMNKIFTRLAVVDNNTAETIGGGGTPRQPLAPPLAP